MQVGIFKICFCVWLVIFTSLCPINVLAKSTSNDSLQLAEQIYRFGNNFYCRPDGWFSGYSSELAFSFSGSYISVIPHPHRYEDGKSYLEFEGVYHIIKIVRRGKHQIIGQLYSPELARGGVDPMYGTVELKTYYFGAIELIVTENGKSKATEFSCGPDIDEMF